MDHTSPQEKTTLDTKFARALYASGMALSAFNTFYWADFFHHLRPSYILPTPYFLSGPLLTAEYERCVASNNEKIQNASSLGIMTDSYTNIRRESVIDIIITTPAPVLHKQVFRGENRETGEYVGNELVTVIREKGPNKFLIVVTDNAANMQVAWEIVVTAFPHITAIGCASHCWDLLFKDLIEIISVIDKYYKHARNVVRFMKRSSNALAVFQAKQREKYGKNAITLKLPAKTRWAGAVILLNSLLKNKSALQETVISDDLDIDRNVRECVLASKFWERIKCISDLLNPIHASITLIEGNRALLSDVYFLHCKINKCISVNLSKLRLSSDEKRSVKLLLKERKEYTVAPIHMAAYLLDPRYMGEGLEDEEEGEAIVFISKLAEHMGIDAGIAIANLGEFRAGEGFFKTKSIMDASKNLHPAVWWSGVCSRQPLSRLASNLLSMPPTASECERRWSDHGFIHDKTRNRLLNSRVTKLVTTRATLVAAQSKAKGLEPLSVQEMQHYFETYLVGHGQGGQGDGVAGGNEEDEVEVSDEESEDEETEWEVDSDEQAEMEDDPPPPPPAQGRAQAEAQAQAISRPPPPRASRNREAAASASAPTTRSLRKR